MLSSKFKTLTKYQLSMLKLQTIILFVVLVINLMIGIIAKRSNLPSNAGSLDPVTLIWVIFIGFAIFNEVFGFSIMHGISRKSYAISSIITMLATSILRAVVTGVLVLIAKQTANINIIYSVIYSTNFLTMILWYTTMLFLVMVISWFFTILFYRISKIAKIILLSIMVLIVPIVVLLDNFMNGLIVNIGKFTLMFLGVFNSPPNAYLSILMLGALSIIFIVSTWVILRRLERK